MASLHHYTTKAGYNAIRSTPTWRFKAHRQRGKRPFGAYFTPVTRDTLNLASKLRTSQAKTKFVFEFVDVDDLIPLPGARGDYVYYSKTDYRVERARQKYQGPV